MSAGPTELRARATPRLPLTVKAGNPRPITVRASVYDRTVPPAAIVPPHLDLLISNETAQQQQSSLLGGTHPTDPRTGPHAPRFPNRPSPTPTSPGQDTDDRLTRQ
ncbi:hypothetical protein [Streptomyces sp. NPDC086182]|uniref:hypothetical protein n=1 Tax=Streptomyces sp. NPDC086182 TaxID=3155058 RepID=UPI003435CD6B